MDKRDRDTAQYGTTRAGEVRDAVPINPAPAPPRILWSDGADPGELVVQIRSTDRAGLLARLTAVFERDGMDIAWAKVTTLGSSVVDVFGITVAGGSLVNMPGGIIAAAGSAITVQGGTLANAVVVDGGKVLNPCGLRMPDEFVRHKLLDAVGDLALAGAPIAGRFVAHRSGHSLNNRLLRALFADATAWRRVGAGSQTEPAWMMPASREMSFATA